MFVTPHLNGRKQTNHPCCIPLHLDTGELKRKMFDKSLNLYFQLINKNDFKLFLFICKQISEIFNLLLNFLNRHFTSIKIEDVICSWKPRRSQLCWIGSEFIVTRDTELMKVLKQNHTNCHYECRDKCDVTVDVLFSFMFFSLSQTFFYIIFKRVLKQDRDGNNKGNNYWY